eukprot:scaffold9618_cov41-Cyclotella_meneghiniana.AAC.5
MHSPLTFPSHKRSLPPTIKNPLRSEIDTKATTNVVGNRFAGCASCGSCGVGQPHELQNTAHFKQTKIDVASHLKQQPYACQVFFVDGRHHTLNVVTGIGVVEVTMV